LALYSTPARAPELALTKLGFGGAAIGLTNYMDQFDANSAGNRAASITAIRKAAALGMNYFDTAPGYGNGLSEELMGEALEGLATPLFVATKVSLSAKEGITASLKASLSRLRRSSVDLLQLHGSSYTDENLDQIFKKGGALDELKALQGDGLIKKIGFTTEDNNAAVYALINSGQFDAMQIAYNLLLQHPYEPTRPFGSLYEAKKQGMLVATMRTATSGIFQRWVQMVNPANTFDYTESLLQFVMSNNLVDVALVGLRTEAMVDSAMVTWRNESGRIDIDKLWNRYV
jgi:aryl-alcohol dehydrogenase-like predicted oxidoreductase